MTQDKRTQYLLALVAAVVETVQECADHGAPAGVMYAAMMTHFPRITLGQFTSLMQVVEATGKVRRSGNLYFSVQG